MKLVERSINSLWHSFRLVFLPGLLLFPAFCSCQGGGSGSGKRPVLESPDLTKKDIAALHQLELLWAKTSPDLHAEYQREKLQLLAARPVCGPWLAKTLTAMAVESHENMVRQNVRVRDFMRSKQGNESFLGRTRTEMASLGQMGRDAIIVYLLRDKRAQNRTVGVILFENTPDDTLFPSLEREYQHGELSSIRAIIQICSERPGSKHSLALLEKASGHPSWKIRGLAVRPWAECMRVQHDPDAARKLWSYYANETDSFVRKQCLLAIGELKDSNQVRPLIEQAEKLERRGDRKEVQAAIQALEILTGSKAGKTASAWLKWLNG